MCCLSYAAPCLQFLLTATFAASEESEIVTHRMRCNDGPRRQKNRAMLAVRRNKREPLQYHIVVSVMCQNVATSDRAIFCGPRSVGNLWAITSKSILSLFTSQVQQQHTTMQISEATEKTANRANDALAQRKQWRQTMQQAFRDGHRQLLQQQLEFFKMDDPAYQRLVQRVQQIQDTLEKELEELCQNYDGQPRPEQRPDQPREQRLEQRPEQQPPEQQFRRRERMMKRSAALSSLFYDGFFGPVSSSSSAATFPVRSAMVRPAKAAATPPFFWETHAP